MAARRVVVTGLGQITPHGRAVAAGFEAVLAGRSAVRRHAVGEAAHSTTLATAVCADFDAGAELGRPRAITMDRVSQLSVLATRAAGADAGLPGVGAAKSSALTDAERERACVMWGTGACGIQTLERGYRELFVKGRPRISPLSVVMGMNNAAAGATEVGYVNAHGTATTEGDPVEADALRRLFGGHAPQVAVSATKSMHGHLMGAAGALEALITVLAVHGGNIPPTAHLRQIDPACAGLDPVLGSGRHAVDLALALCNSFAFGGSNTVLAFRRHAA